MMTFKKKQVLFILFMFAFHRIHCSAKANFEHKKGYKLTVKWILFQTKQPCMFLKVQFGYQTI